MSIWFIFLMIEGVLICMLPLYAFASQYRWRTSYYLGDIGGDIGPRLRFSLPGCKICHFRVSVNDAGVLTDV